MRVKIENTIKNEIVNAQILSADNLSDMPLKGNDWNFNWRELYKKGGYFYKIIVDDEPNEIQGIVRFSIKENEMLYLENIELAPHNLGAKGKYNLLAGSLLAYCCKQSFILGKNPYQGFVVFDSKTKLINFYMEKYGASLLFGQRMCFYPDASNKLIDKYLK